MTARANAQALVAGRRLLAHYWTFLIFFLSPRPLLQSSPKTKPRTCARARIIFAF